MVDAYDWLGIPKTQRPPTYFQLLAVERSETAGVAIRTAALRQIRKLDSHLVGPNSELAEKLIKEIEEARDVLLNPERRQIYELIAPDPTGGPKPTVSTTSPTSAAASGGTNWWQEGGGTPAASPATGSQSQAVPSASTSSPTAGGSAAWWQDGGSNSTPPSAVPPAARAPGAASAPAPNKVSAGATWWEGGKTEKPVIPTPVNTGPTSYANAPSGGSSFGNDPGLVARSAQARAKKSGGLPIGMMIATLVGIAGLAAGIYAFTQAGKKSTETNVGGDTVADRGKGGTTGDTGDGEDHPDPKDPNRPPRPKSKDKTKDPVGKSVTLDATPPSPKNFNSLEAQILKGHTAPVLGVAVMKNGSFFVSISSDRTIRLWSFRTMQSVVRHTMDSKGVALGFAAGDNALVAADTTAIATMDAAKITPARTIAGIDGRINVFAVAPDGMHGVYGQTDGVLKRFRTIGASEVFATLGKSAVTGVAISNDGTRVAVSLSEGLVSVWDLPNRRKIHEWKPHMSDAICVAFSPDGNRVVSGGVDHSAVVMDLTTKKEVAKYKGHQGEVLSAVYLSDGKRIVTGGGDSTVRMWDGTTGADLRWNFPVQGKPLCIAVDGSDRYVVSGTGTANVHVFPLPMVRLESEPGPLAAAPKERLPLPPAKDISAAIATIRQELSADYSQGRSSDLAVLAEKLLIAGTREGVVPARRLGFLRESAAIATKAGAIESAMRAIDSMDAWFEVDDLAERAAVLEPFSSARETPDLYPQTMKLIARADREYRPEVGRRLTAALLAGDLETFPKDFQPVLTAYRKYRQAAEDDAKRFQKALVDLKTSADDVGASQVYGEYLCFSAQQWAKGLPYLARGNDPKLRELAKRDVAGTADGKEMVKLGESWYQAAQSADSERTKSGMLIRARYWLDRSGKEKLDTTDQIKSKSTLSTVKELINLSEAKMDLPRVPTVIVRRSMNTMLNDATLREQWTVPMTASFVDQRVVAKSGPFDLTTRFAMGDDWKFAIALTGDGRDVRVIVHGIDMVIPGRDRVRRVIVRRQADKITWTAVRDGKPDETKTLPLAKDGGPSPLVFRLDGAPLSTDDLIVEELNVSGSIHPTVLKPE